MSTFFVILFTAILFLPFISASSSENYDLKGEKSKIDEVPKNHKLLEQKELMKAFLEPISSFRHGYYRLPTYLGPLTNILPKTRKIMNAISNLGDLPQIEGIITFKESIKQNAGDCIAELKNFLKELEEQNKGTKNGVAIATYEAKKKFAEEIKHSVEKMAEISNA